MSSDGIFTVPMLCAGLALVGCCLIIPQADENRRLAHQVMKLESDLEHVQRQIAINSDFLDRLETDVNLAERLAQRQMKLVRQGTSVLELKGRRGEMEMSPFDLVTLPAPPEMPAYQPVGGRFSHWCRTVQTRLYLLGAGMLLMAGGLVLGASSRD